MHNSYRPQIRDEGPSPDGKEKNCEFQYRLALLTLFCAVVSQINVSYAACMELPFIESIAEIASLRDNSSTNALISNRPSLFSDRLLSVQFSRTPNSMAATVDRGCELR